MMDTYSVGHGSTVLGVVTGKPITLGGSQGRAASTWRGVVATGISRRCVTFEDRTVHVEHPGGSVWSVRGNRHAEEMGL